MRSGHLIYKVKYLIVKTKQSFIDTNLNLAPENFILIISETSMFDFKVEIILLLKSVENVSVGFFVKRIPSIKNFKTKIVIF